MVTAQIQKWFPNDEGEYTFMHDSAPCHKARSVIACLDEICHSFALAKEFTRHESHRIRVGAHQTDDRKEVITTKQQLIESENGIPIPSSKKIQNMYWKHAPTHRGSYCSK